MDGPSTSTKPGKQARQKRVLPSRSRRGGPGVGNCEVDLMIMETQRRKYENEPLIPASTRFLLTTNPAVASTSGVVSEINIHANERYFDRPDVLKAYREQQVIQTPEFENVAGIPVAPGRLRARSQSGTTGTSAEASNEDSDIVYEKRHRKYETFEKRQRLREKEKLKHEQYKLKERIEQLRAMDSAAFLALPPSLFPAPPGNADEEREEEEEEDTDESGTNINGVTTLNEGERRQKEMLGIAFMLEERYRVLLPPERIKKPGQATMEPSIEPEASFTRRDTYDEEPDEEPFLENAQKETEKLKLKIKFPGRLNPTIHTPASKSASYKKHKKNAPPKQPPSGRRTKVPQEAIFVPSESPQEQEDSHPVDSNPTALPSTELPQAEPPHAELPQAEHPPAPSPPVASPPPESFPVETENIPLPSSPVASPSPPSMPPAGQQPPSRPTTPMSNPDITVLELDSPALVSMKDEGMSTEPFESISAPRLPKRVKLSIPPSSSSRHVTRELSVPHIASISAPARERSPSHASTMQSSKNYASHGSKKSDRITSLLLISAMRSSGNRAQKGKRHTSAFGAKLRNEAFEELRDFELPAWMNVSYPTDDPMEEDVPGPEPAAIVEDIPGARTIMSAAEFTREVAGPGVPSSSTRVEELQAS